MVDKGTKSILYILAILLAFATYPLWWVINWLIDWWTPTYHKEGIFAVVGRTGAGKSLFKTYLELQEENHNTITFTNVESDAVNSVVEKLENIWNNDECQVNFNGSGVNLMTFDEPQLDFDNRDFKKDSYKQVFQPFAKTMSIHRHQKVRRVFFFTQSWGALDSKIKRIVHYVIDVDHTKMIDIPYMVENKKIERIPKALKLTVFRKQDYEDNKEYFEMVKSGFFQTKIKLEDLDRYRIGITKTLLDRHDTYVFEDYLKDKPIYKPEKVDENNEESEDLDNV